MRAQSYDTDTWLDLAALARDERRLERSVSSERRPIALALRDLGWCAVAMALFVIIVKGAFVEAFVIPSGSMTPTLRVNDYILVPKFLYGLHIPLVDETVIKWGAPKRGDVIVFSRPTRGSELKSSSAFVKRVIAQGGDTVEVVGTSVYLNGRAIVEPYAHWNQHPAGSERIGPFVVPEGKVFVLGDNRSNSEDSRAWADPFVPLSSVVGRAVVVYWSDATAERAGTIL